MSTREKSVCVPGLLELMGYGRISGTAVEPCRHRVRRNAPRPFAGPSPPRVSLVLRAAQPINDKPMWIDYCRTIMRGCVDPQEKSVIVPGLSGFLKRAQDSTSSHGGAALMSEPQPIRGKRIWLGFHVVRSGFQTVDHRYCSRVLGPVEIRGIHESGMGPCLPRVRWASIRLGRRCGARTNQRLANGIGVFSPYRKKWCRPEKARFAPPVDGSFRYVERPLDKGWDPISPRGGAGSTYGPWPIRKLAGGVGVSTPCGEVSTRMISVFVPGCRSCRCVDGFRSRNVALSCPVDAYFVCESWPMSDQANTICLIFVYKNSSLKFLNC